MSERKITVGSEYESKEITVDVPDTYPPIWDRNAELRVVGGSYPRLEAPEKVTGQARYTADMQPKDLLIARILRSPHPAARIKSLDDTAARAMPGVRAIVYDFDRNNPSSKRLNYAGDEILAIAADTAAQAEDALRAIKVEYEMAPFVVDQEAARKSDAPAVMGGDRANAERMRGRGNLNDAEKHLAEADQVIEATYRTPVQTHSCLETHGLCIEPLEDGGLTVYASTQGTFSVRDGLADALKIPREKVQVICRHMGGGFGSKFGPRTEGILCARLALETKRPVKLMLDRKEEHLSGGNRPSSVQTVKLGARKDGKLAGALIRTHGTGGVAPRSAGCAIPIVYHFPEGSVFKEEETVLTNAGPACAMRAPGYPQGVFAMEQAMDELAFALGMDPLEFRLANDSNPVRKEQYRIGALEIGWDARHKEPGKGPLRDGKLRGVGVAATQWFNSGRGPAHADVEIHRDGRVVLKQGAQDIGTGFRTAMVVIVAEELGLDPKDITGDVGNTQYGYGPASGGSTTTPSTAPAVHAAAYNAAQQLRKEVARSWKVKPDEIELKGGEVASSAGGKRVSFKQACALLTADKITAGGDREDNFAGYADGVAGCQFAEVEVDPETGEVRVVKIVAIQDSGRALNRLTLESQITGGVIQGLSYALFEQRIMDRNTGHMVNANFMEYKIAGPADIPEIVPIVMDIANGKNSVGAMGIGEPPVVPTAAAIANAVYHAIGRRVYELPLTPDRILAALGTAT